MYKHRTNYHCTQYSFPFENLIWHKFYVIKHNVRDVRISSMRALTTRLHTGMETWKFTIAASARLSCRRLSGGCRHCCQYIFVPTCDFIFCSHASTVDYAKNDINTNTVQWEPSEGKRERGRNLIASVLKLFYAVCTHTHPPHTPLRIYSYVILTPRIRIKTLAKLVVDGR